MPTRSGGRSIASDRRQDRGCAWRRGRVRAWRRSNRTPEADVIRADGPAYAPFKDIWLRDDRASARPNDVLVAADGSLLISDDQGGRIYRVTHANTERRSIYRK